MAAIKGVSKNVIEVCDSDNECFERVILFVRPGRRHNGNEDISEKAKDYVQSLKLRRGFYKKRSHTLAAAIAVTAIIASGLTAGFFLLFL